MREITIIQSCCIGKMGDVIEFPDNLAEQFVDIGLAVDGDQREEILSRGKQFD